MSYDPDALDRRDPAFIARVLPIARGFARHYLSCQWRGIEHIPDRPALFVANHNGGIAGPDLVCTLALLWSVRGPGAPLYALAHDFAMKQLRPLGRVLQRLGAVAASRRNAARVLDGGGQVLVYPGGDLDASALSRSDPPLLSRSDPGWRTGSLPRMRST
jgi:1-acyl-sn-glycerol-3-phosphate acyltransferase